MRKTWYRQMTLRPFWISHWQVIRGAASQSVTSMTLQAPLRAPKCVHESACAVFPQLHQSSLPVGVLVEMSTTNDMRTYANELFRRHDDLLELPKQR